jgi:membrane fusion protein, multidrug efflux system
MNVGLLSPSVPTLAWALALLLLTGCGRGDETQNPDPSQRPPSPVTVLRVAPEDVAVPADYAARARGAREVEVRAQVAGSLLRRLYTEGAQVEVDAPLFQIDPEPFVLALATAEAELADAQARSAQAQREWDRARGLFQQDAVSRRERDLAQAEYELAGARAARAEAALAEARLQLRYTDVRAPLAGVTDRESLPEGSVIERGALLTRITQRDPVHVLFALPETDALHYRRNGVREVALVLADGSDYALPGEMDFAASTVDPQLGTMAVRAVFPNPDDALVPGQFVRVRVQLQRLQGIYRIPQRALIAGRNGAQVFVVDDEGRARSREVTLGPVVDRQQLVTAGLHADDRVVVEGHVALRDGAAVRVVQPGPEGG